MTTETNSTSPQVLQTFALLQIAAEAFLGRNREAPAATPGCSYSVTWDAAALMAGNEHSSRMTAKQAAQFASEWTVVSHRPNTATVFSATLCQWNGTKADSTRGLEPGGGQT